MNQLFKKLVEIPSLSGREQKLMDVLDTELKDYVDTIETDPLGNNIKKIGQGKIPVMITAHGDEVGFIVTYIDKKGFAYFKPLGGIKNDIAVGQKVQVLTADGKIAGVIGRDKQDEISSSSKPKDMWIDTGVTENTNHVQVGDRVFFDSYVEQLQDNCVIARGADNKAGVFATTEIIKHYSKNQNKNITLYTVITSREESHKRGALAVVDSINPSYALVIDTTYATDTPGADIEGEGDIKIGKGPVISIGASTDDRLFRKFQEIAKKHTIPLQITAESKTTSTETDIIQSGAGGVVSMIISLPVRYMHTSAVLFNWQDVESTIKLINHMLDEIHTL